MSPITLRDVEAEDILKLKAMINDTWKWEDLVKEEAVLGATIALYFNQVLYGSSYGKVALQEGEVIGAIFGHVDGEVPTCRMLQEDGLEHTLTLLQAAEDERQNVYKCLSELNATYGQLVDGKEDSYDGTLVFLAVAEKVQGLGVGKQLWNDLASYFKEKNAKSIYVFTDTDCDFGFYDHQGFSRKDTQHLTCTFSEDIWDVDIFLYDYEFQQK